LSSNLELWGGLECTINRVGDTFRDQLEYTGHYQRPADVDAIAKLGIKAIRFPMLWERHQKNKQQTIDWEWAHQNLTNWKGNGVMPIVGLVHHGSGPLFTNLLDENFPTLIADYARKVAEQFPWISHYTPVNEPLTTARFSGLYGFWYPHHQTDKSFARMLINQLKGVALSMAAVRTINPNAQLVQTEDLASVHSTKTLQYQANFENKRAWLTFDLLAGRVDRHHALWKYLLKAGIRESELYFFIDNPCPPDIMGLNYYITSERFLDRRLSRYPAHTHGGNGHHRYADVEAVRVKEPTGLPVLLQKVWENYRLPIAITEAHLNCTREEQMRWFQQVWNHCKDARSKGVDVKAVTAWSLLGCFDWDSLLTKEQGHYEPGVFRLEEQTLRETALVPMIKSMAKAEEYSHPLLEGEGWWQRDMRFFKSFRQKKQALKVKETSSPLLIIGKHGTLATAFSKICVERGIHAISLSREEFEISDELIAMAMIDKLRPWAVVNASGFVRVDDAEINQELCYKTNTEGPKVLSRICRAKGIRFMTFSTDMVFDGAKQSPYTEIDVVKPLNVYGESKAMAEVGVLNNDSSALVIRTSSFFGPWDRYNFAFHVLESLRSNNTFSAVDNLTISPTYVPDLVHHALDLLIDGAGGIWHVTNNDTISWADFAVAIAERGGYTSKKISAVSLASMQWRATRPPYSALKNSRGLTLPTLDHALERFFSDKVY